MDLITGHRRMRRNRKADWTRRMVQENRLTVDDLIWPIFVVPGTNIVEPIAAMPGVNRMSIDKAVEAAKLAADLGIPALATFPNVDISLRDDTGSNSLAENNLINETTRAIKKAVPDIGVITDVALDPFTSHGHDGILRDGEIVNDETVAQIAIAAVMQADAGADIIAPSDMMDGRIGAIRHALDAAGHQNVGIMAYATKFASAFYGPYREAIGTSGLLKGDKKTYYIDPANGTEAMRDAALDVEEGADMLMVKPGLPYLDICWRMKESFGLPVFGLSGLRRICADQGRCRQWLDRWRTRHARNPACLQACRLRRHSQLFRCRCGPHSRQAVTPAAGDRRKNVACHQSGVRKMRTRLRPASLAR